MIISDDKQAKYNLLTVHKNLPMLNEAIHNFEGRGSGGPGLILSESVQTLQNILDLVLSKNFHHEFFFVALRKHKISARATLTYTPLLDLLRCQGESRENLYHDLYDNVRHGFRHRDLCIDVEPAEKALDGLKQVDESVIACANILRRLIYPDVTTIAHGSSEKRRASSKTPKAANIAFAGGNGYKMLISKMEWE